MSGYDPKTCVTAGDLRSYGFTIPESIPDVAYIPRDGFQFKLIRISGDDPDGVFDAQVDVTFVEPFRWMKIKIVLDVDDEAPTTRIAAPVQDYAPTKRTSFWDVVSPMMPGDAQQASRDVVVAPTTSRDDEPTKESAESPDLFDDEE